MNTHGSGSGQIWLDNVECTGHERRFTQCMHAGWGNHNCDHSQDVSVSCFFDASRQYAGQKPRLLLFVFLQSSSSSSSFANLSIIFTTHRKRRSIASSPHAALHSRDIRSCTWPKGHNLCPWSQCGINHAQVAHLRQGLNSGPHNFTVITFIHTKYSKNEDNSHTLIFFILNII